MYVKKKDRLLALVADIASRRHIINEDYSVILMSKEVITGSHYNYLLLLLACGTEGICNTVLCALCIYEGKWM